MTNCTICGKYMGNHFPIEDICSKCKKESHKKQMKQIFKDYKSDGGKLLYKQFEKKWNDPNCTGIDE